VVSFEAAISLIFDLSLSSENARWLLSELGLALLTGGSGGYSSFFYIAVALPGHSLDGVASDAGPDVARALHIRPFFGEYYGHPKPAERSPSWSGWCEFTGSIFRGTIDVASIRIWLRDPIP
jgi:hypothetical protein